MYVKAQVGSINTHWYDSQCGLIKNAAKYPIVNGSKTQGKIKSSITLTFRENRMEKTEIHALINYIVIPLSLGQVRQEFIMTECHNKIRYISTMQT